MPHDHGNAHMDPTSGDRRVSVAIWANALLTVAQVVGGIFSGSLALIADALHNPCRRLSDLRGRDALYRANGGRWLDRRYPRLRGARGRQLDRMAHLVDAERQREHPRALPTQSIRRTGLSSGDHRGDADHSLRRDLGRSGDHDCHCPLHSLPRPDRNRKADPYVDARQPPRHG